MWFAAAPVSPFGEVSLEDPGMPARSFCPANHVECRQPYDLSRGLTSEVVMREPNAEADLLAAIAGLVQSEGGSVSRHEPHALTGTLTAITSKWFFGGRKVIDTVTCRLARWPR